MSGAASVGFERREKAAHRLLARVAVDGLGQGRILALDFGVRAQIGRVVFKPVARRVFSGFAGFGN